MAGTDISAGLPWRPAKLAGTPLSAIVELAGAASIAGRASIAGVVTGITAGSASVLSGDLFAALPGDHAHGAQYAERAKAAGAVAVLTDPAGAEIARNSGLPIIVVDAPRQILGVVSSRIYGDPSAAMRLVGITGTSGKTTTSCLVRAGLVASGRISAMIGTLGVFAGPDTINIGFTTPEAPQLQAILAVMLERGICDVAMEVSSHALALGRVDGTRFEVGAFTNLSQDHLDFHTDMNAYFAAKSLLFDGRARRELVCVDDDWGPLLRTPETVTVSTGGRAADWRAESITTGPDGSTRFEVLGPGPRFHTGCVIPGRYNVANSLLALAILAELDVDVVEVAPAVAAAQVPGRMQRLDHGQPFLVVIDYSHKPAGVTAALAAMRALTTGRLIIVLGCGGDRDRAKRPVMGRLAAENADVLIVTDDNPRSEDPALIRAAMLAGARAAGGSGATVIEEGDRASAIATALAMARAGDAVLIAGKGHETGQEVGGVMLAFDDVTVSAQALGALGFSA
jgi:UDP-N-acetylmuramoyl-L-alanyl-D-glutamate--2,6-diaminopimelate ligase